MALRLVAPPTAEIITLDEAKAYMRVDHDDDDVLIGQLIVAARERVEGPPTNAIYATQTWELVLDAFPSADIMLPLAPVQYVEAVTYYDTDGLQQVVDPSMYFLDDVSRPPFVLLVDGSPWPETLGQANAMAVRFVAGYPAASGDVAANIPQVVKLAIKQLVSHWYERRDMVLEVPTLTPVPEFVWQLLHRWRMFL